MERSEILAAAAAAHAARIAEEGGDDTAARARAEQVRRRADGLLDRFVTTEGATAGAATDGTATASGDGAATESEARDAQRRRAGEAARAAARTEGSLSDWQRMGTRRGVTPDDQVRTAWTVAGVPEQGDARALANVLLSTAGHAGRVADAARRNPRLSGAASAAARRTVRRYTDHGADMASLGDVLNEPQPPSDQD
ncbi:hypothetical protein SAMN02800687_2047 [Curtobacterium sp. UNCCL20]|uniref:hypothetical protein n=1 Tax=Curtobacterium sp. UNCCL20 TaxID=1502773 RepID=UPI00087EEA62|nr:hypothetical protein [Curtobacterium sp. UNCCL20]SDQ60068.1 hypothetical protein SAMN02800687_2047 [Curtobacterium sp. UNCCL20]